MADLDIEQNARIRDVENRVNDIENQLHLLIGKLDQTMTILKIVCVGIGAVVGIDLQGMI